MKNTAEILKAGLARTWPGWSFWIIYPAVGPLIWCASPNDGSIQAINTDTPQALNAAIKAHMRGALRDH
jgi:hypothetical protein